jgi:hypothetical protein
MNVKIADYNLKKIKAELQKIAALEKTAAQLQIENEILLSTLDMVAAGELDSAVAIDKVAAFIKDPTELRLYKIARQRASNSLGSAIESDRPDTTDGSSEDKLLERLTELSEGSY